MRSLYELILDDELDKFERRLKESTDDNSSCSHHLLTCNIEFLRVAHRNQVPIPLEVFYIAADRGDLEKVKFCVEECGIEVNAGDGEALRRCLDDDIQLNVFHYLLDKGANVNFKRGEFGSLAWITVDRRSSYVLKKLMEYGLKLDDPPSNYDDIIGKAREFKVSEHSDGICDIELQGFEEPQTYHLLTFALQSNNPILMFVVEECNYPVPDSFLEGLPDFCTIAKKILAKRK